LIPFDFEYYKPDSVKDAVELYHHLLSENKDPLYYSGGTEIITMARVNQIVTQAVIDIKGIPECNALESDADQVHLGAAIPLARLEEVKAFPLLSRVCNRIADHTSRCKITLGGNICGKIMYREAVLPLLLADSDLLIAGKDGLRKVSIHQIFQRHINLQPGEFVAQIRVRKQYVEMPYVTEKRTKIDRIDYPLVTIAALNDGEAMRMSFSGLCAFPFRSGEMEEILNDRRLAPEERANRALSLLPDSIVDDINGSASYRRFVAQGLAVDAIHTFERGNA